jgi:hypothetical protein
MRIPVHITSPPALYLLLLGIGDRDGSWPEANGSRTSTIPADRPPPHARTWDATALLGMFAVHGSSREVMHG